MADQTEKPKGNILEQFVQYVTDKENVWDPNRYLKSRTLSGLVFNQESQLSFQYVLGNAYMEGYVGDLTLQVFYHGLNGFQAIIHGAGEALPVTPLPFHPSRGGGNEFIAYVKEAVALRAGGG